MSGTTLTNPFRFPPGYVANGVNFDGTNDYLTRGADLTGVADSKLWSGSLWFKRTTTGSKMEFYAGTTQRPNVFIHSNNTLRITARNVGGSTILDLRTSAVTDTAAWHHLMWSVDLADTGKRHVYVDGSSDLVSVNAYSDDTIDFSRTDHAICGRTDGTNKYDGCVADIWLAFAQCIDLGVAANRLKFYNAGSPVDLGSDGSTPTGTAPIMYFSGDTTGWESNDGSGGGFTENGALSDCADSP